MSTKVVRLRPRQRTLLSGFTKKDINIYVQESDEAKPVGIIIDIFSKKSGELLESFTYWY